MVKALAEHCGHYNKALSYVALILATQKKSAKGCTDLDEKEALSDSADICIEQGNYDKALELYTQASEIKKKSLVDQDLDMDMASILHSMAICYYRLGKYEKALDLYTQSLDIPKPIVGDKHEVVGETLTNMADCNYNLGNFAEALKLHTKVLDIYKKTLGDDHSDVKDSLAAIKKIKSVIG